MPNVFSTNLTHGRFETWTTKPDLEILHAKQVHGIDIVSTQTLPCDADGIVVSWEEFKTPLAIKTADCLPVVIEGEKGVVFLHAGWRGLASGIFERPEIHMIMPLRVYIGPSIHSCCFEVSPDFKENFPKSSHFSRIRDQWHFNLQAEANDRLESQFPGIVVEISELCTCCEKDLNSYRRNKTSERNWNLYIKG